MSVDIVGATRCAPTGGLAGCGCRYGLGGMGELGVFPFLIAGTALAAGTLVAAWLSQTDWSVGEYNDWMLTMNQTIAQWDKIGWDSGCWAKSPQKRQEWLLFWKRFSTHYGVYGKISNISYVSDSAEKPARELMKQLINWGTWLNDTCGAATTGGAIAPPPPGEPPPSGPTDWVAIAKWGGIGVGALVVLSLVANIRAAFPART